MNISRKEKLKERIRTSLSVIRFLLEDKVVKLEDKNMALINENIISILKNTEEF